MNEANTNTQTTTFGIPKFQEGDTVYVGTEARYYGKGLVLKVENIFVAGHRTYVVQIGTKRGQVAEDQLFATAKAAREHATRTIWQG